MRAIHAVRELNCERADESITIIALYTEPERSAMFVRQADEAYPRPAATVDADGSARRLPGLRGARAGADRSPGPTLSGPAGASSPSTPSSRTCASDSGIVFVGPDRRRHAGAGRQDRSPSAWPSRPACRSRPWSGGAGRDRRGRRAPSASSIGFPLMIKAAAGGGGRGIRRVESADELENAFERAREEAQKSFGDGTCFMESVGRQRAPHRGAADRRRPGHGVGRWACATARCQRRHQKVVEESVQPRAHAPSRSASQGSGGRLALELPATAAPPPSSSSTSPRRSASPSWRSTRACRSSTPSPRRSPALDLVKLQLARRRRRAARGRAVRRPVGHAIEARLNAEDPAHRASRPRRAACRCSTSPTGPGCASTAASPTGDVIPPEFDSMIAKVIAYGRTATRRSRGCAARCATRSRSSRTARPTAPSCSRSSTARSCVPARSTPAGSTASAAGRDPGRRATPMPRSPRPRSSSPTTRPPPSAPASTRSPAAAVPRRRADVRRTVDLRHRGAVYRFAVSQIGPHRYALEIDDSRIEAELERVSEHERRISFGAGAHRTLISAQDADLLVEVDGVPHRISRDEGGLFAAPAPRGGGDPRVGRRRGRRPGTWLPLRRA